MSNYVQSFQDLLKNQKSLSSALYSNIKPKKSNNFKPNDVISSVSLQLKAIQAADSFKSNKNSYKGVSECKKSTYMCVNKYAVYQELSKQPKNFDTQCVTDTQLISVIEDAEIIEAHHGMTQEFDTSFNRLNTEMQDDIQETNKNIDKDVAETVSTEKRDKDKSAIEIYKSFVDGITVNDNATVTKTTNCDVESNNKANKPKVNTQELVLSQILYSKAGSNKPKMAKKTDLEEKTKIYYTPIDEESQLLNKCIEIDIDDTEVPLSPIFTNKSIKTKPRTPSPLVYNLDAFEQFESIAMPLLDTNNLETKYVINSQILNKELHLNMNKYCELNERVTSSPDNIINNEVNLGSPIIETNIEVLEIDKATSKEILKQLASQDNEQTNYKDEILFSSDEEEDYIQKDIQNLPFTCPLEASFHNQSGFLDKTMYVGFQTASNRSIQVCTDSFAKAKALFNEVTVTDLVRRCDNSVAKTSKSQENLDTHIESKEFDLPGKKAEDTVQNLLAEDFTVNKTEVMQAPFENPNCMGFMTANNKKINLSEKALARCKKVFQNIDLNENFKEKYNIMEKVISCEAAEHKIKSCWDGNKTTDTKENLDDVLQGIDDVIIQEFENIEMSLKHNEDEKAVLSIGFKTASKDVKNLENNLEKIKVDIFKDIDFNETSSTPDNAEEITIKTDKRNMKLLRDCVKSNTDFSKIKTSELQKEDTAVSQQYFNEPSTSKACFGIDVSCLAETTKMYKEGDTKASTIQDMNQPSTSKGFIGFKTGNNKNIKISHQAWSKTKDIFNEIAAIDLPNLSNKDYPKNDTIQTKNTPSVADLKTASNRDIITPKEAIVKSRQPLNDICPNVKEKTDTDNAVTAPGTTFVGFKSASNKKIKVDTVLSQTNKIFEDIGNMKDLGLITEDKECKAQENIKMDTFVGFKSASNKEIKISVKALAHTRNIFRDIEDIEPALTKHEKNREPTDRSYSDINCLAFKTANSKPIKTSKDALAKNLFKDFDSSDFKLPNKYILNNAVSDANENMDKIQQVPFENNVQYASEFQGFKTASNKQVKISSKALIKSKNIFKDIADNTKDMYPKETYQEKDIHTELINDVHYRSTSPLLKGFQTANNNYVCVSAKALINSKKIFNETTKDIYPKELINVNSRSTSPVYKGFQTANKKPVAVSAKVIRNSKKIFEDFDNEESDAKTPFTGFQTASNKKLSISEKALAKSRKLFEDLSCTDNVNNKKVKEKSLYPAEIYQDEDPENKDPSFKLEIKDSNKVFKGFCTASKKPVAISKLALEESNKIFHDETSYEKLRSVGFPTSNYQAMKIYEEAQTEKDTPLEVDNPVIRSFKGFQTASNKSVLVSEEALAKSKKVFQDYDTIVNNYEIEEKGTKKIESLKFAFQTGNNDTVGVSDEAVARSKRLFSEIDKEDHNIVKKSKNQIDDENIHAYIDTQVINNFDESLHTEDFHETPKRSTQSKRSGSPILSCPKAKRRKKFEIPYSQKFTKVEKTDPKPVETDKNENRIWFKEEYKRSKEITLKDLEKMSINITTKIDPYLCKFNYDNLLQFEFGHDRNDLSDDNMTIDSLKDSFLKSVNAKLVPDGWLDNHLKLILWKLISYEIKFKSTVVCTARNVIDQLKYRFDKELYNTQRSALRRIFEKDDVPSKTLVLCVLGIFENGVKVTSATSTTASIELELTDGWYSIRCTTDRMLAELISSGKISIGMKIVTSGAELSASEQGVAPWEDTSAIRLKIFGNSTRRARWDARLGYHGNGAILSQLSSVKLHGGKISKLRLFVTRVYSELYVEKFEDGSTVTRSERLENLHQMKTEAERQTFMEKLYEEVEKEFADKEYQDSEGPSSCKRPSMDSGSQIAKAMRNSRDPSEFRAQLTESQSCLLEAHNLKTKDRLLDDIQRRVRERIEKAGVCVNRNVVSLLKIRVIGLKEKGDEVEVTKGMMSIWKPNDAIREIIKEDSWIDVLNVIPTSIRYSEIQLSAGRQSIFSIPKYKIPDNFKPYTQLLQRKCFTIKDFAQNPTMTTDYNEIDILGLIFLVEPSSELFDSTKQSFQNVYLTDADKNFICINFWGGLKKFGYQNVLDTGQLVMCGNLQKRAGNTRKCIPQYRVTELSYFTQTPKNVFTRKMLDDLNKKIVSLDKRKFCQECIVLKNNYFVSKQNNENVSPYRFINNDVDSSKNKIFIDSPLARDNKLDDFNLTGLDFESTFKQDSQLSDEVLQRKRKLNEKIARLKMYGEPPPLSPMHMINRSKHATSSYKSPLLCNNNNSSNHSPNSNMQNSWRENPNRQMENDSTRNVANLKNTPQKCVQMCDVGSPVLLNRTYVKNVNPVKIDFDVKDNNDSYIDHFAEEFDGSPPLSLD